MDTTVQFAVDATVAYVDVIIVRDGVFEEDEHFTVQLHNSGHVEDITEPSTATVTIKSEDRKLTLDLLTTP